MIDLIAIIGWLLATLVRGVAEDVLVIVGVKRRGPMGETWRRR